MSSLLVGILVVLGVFIIPAALANFIGVSLRLPEYRWKLFVVFFTTALGIAIIATGKPMMGIDLVGGINLVYDLDDKSLATLGRTINVEEDLIVPLRKRIDPSGLQELTLRKFGDNNQIEIIMPGGDKTTADMIENKITNSGSLKFQILANPRDHFALIQDAQRARNQGETIIRDAAGTIVAEWVPVKRFANGKLALDVVPGQPGTFQSPDHPEPEVLVIVDPKDQEVNGGNLLRSSVGGDEKGRPALHFQFDNVGSLRFGQLTGKNRPEQGHYRQLAVVLDNQIFSAPRINDQINGQGIISGDFTVEEVQNLRDVLNAGSMPAALKKVPSQKIVTGPTLGEDTIYQGAIAMAISFTLVLLFMVYYYRFSGLVASMALILNLIMTVGLMIAFGAVFTLPGLAGLVLTIGMAVDANVLIYERMREELEKGAALRMAIRNGYDRASSTIIDSNLTTLISATVLYVIGSEQIKGFAVSLWLGIAISMYTAVFCTRVVFEIFERKRWITNLKMLRMLSDTHFDFLSTRKTAITGSLLVIAIGLVCTVTRGRDLFDIDFLGGSQVQLRFLEPQDINAVRTAVGTVVEDPVVKSVRDPLKNEANVAFVVETSEQDLVKVETALAQVFAGKLAHNVLTMSDLVALGPDGKPGSAPIPVPPTPEATTPPAATVPPAAKTPAATTPAPEPTTPPAPAATPAATVPPTPEATPAPAATTPATPATTPATPATPAVETPATPATPATETPATPTETPAVTTPQSSRSRSSFGTVAQARALLWVAPFLLLQAEPAAAAQPETPPAVTQPATPATETPATPAATQPATPAVETPAATPPAATAPAPAATTPAATPEVTVPAATTPAPAATTPAATTPAVNTPPATVEAPVTFPPTTLPGGQIPGDGLTGDTLPGTPASLVKFAGGTEVTVKLEHALNRDALASLLSAEFTKRKYSLDRQRFEVTNPEFKAGRDTAHSQWTIRLDLPPALAKPILEDLQKGIAATPYFPFSNKVGSQVAGGTKARAVVAILVSMFFILVYIWFRFHRVSFGLASVIALFHDILVVLAFIAISAYISPFLGWLLIEPFKINLTMIASILTIIGYSLNDKIVVFDRIREVRGKSPKLDTNMMNISVNETLSRTILTASCTLIVLIVLVVTHIDVIHGFAYALLIGVIVGTYSSIFIACPALLWLKEANDSAVATLGKDGKPGTTPAVTGSNQKAGV